MLETAENFAREQGYKEIYVHLGTDYLKSYIFYPKHGYIEYKESYMKKKL